MHDAAHQRAAIRARHHAAVYRMLETGAGTDGPLPPGTEGAIGRAQVYYDGDPEAAALLCEMNLTIFRLRQSLLAGAQSDCRAQREALSRLGAQWLYHAPLFHVAELLPAEVMA